MTIHFGINPKNGGKPPNDKILVNTRNFVSLFFFSVIAIWLTKDNLVVFTIDTTVNVSIE